MLYDIQKPASSARDFPRALQVCVFSACISCVRCQECEERALNVCVRKRETHCRLGRAIGKAARVIKAKLLPPAAVRRDNKGGSPSPLPFHTRPAFLTLLLTSLTRLKVMGKDFLRGRKPHFWKPTHEYPLGETSP